MAQPKSQLIYSSLTLQRNNWQALTLCSQEGLELGGATDKASVVCRSHSVYVSEYYLHQVRVVMIQGQDSCDDYYRVHAAQQHHFLSAVRHAIIN